MPNPKPNRAREERIGRAIVVDAYTPEEHAMRWYYHAEGPLKSSRGLQCAALLPKENLLAPQARNRGREHLLAERNDLVAVVEDNPELEFVSAGIGQFAQSNMSGAGSGHGGAMLRPIRNIVSSNPECDA